MEEIKANTNRLKTDYDSVVLSQTQTTRVVLKAEKFPNSGLRLKLVHQKGSKKWGQDWWDDETRFKKGSLKVGEFVDFELDTDQTNKLLEALPLLANLAELQLDYGQSNLFILKGKERETLNQLLSENGGQFWTFIEELRPGLVQQIAILKEHDKRQRTLELFKTELDKQEWDEPAWQKFFDENTWIFGHGLDYRILDPVVEQAHYGGVDITGRGQQKGDNLLATRANTKFTVLVEIKKPQSVLVKAKEYRNGAYALGDDLIGGVTQLQMNCRTWSRSSQSDENRDILESEGIYTCEPCGILIIGNTSQLSTNRDQRNSFEVFRRGLHNPEVITYDELFERASFIVSHRPSGHTAYPASQEPS